MGEEKMKNSFIKSLKQKIKDNNGIPDANKKLKIYYRIRV